jgi:hypothetical protein
LLLLFEMINAKSTEPVNCIAIGFDGVYELFCDPVTLMTKHTTLPKERESMVGRLLAADSSAAILQNGDSAETGSHSSARGVTESTSRQREQKCVVGGMVDDETSSAFDVSLHLFLDGLGPSDPVVQVAAIEIVDDNLVFEKIVFPLP